MNTHRRNYLRALVGRSRLAALRAERDAAAAAANACPITEAYKYDAILIARHAEVRRVINLCKAVHLHYPKAK